MEDILNHMEWMFNFRSDAGFHFFNLLRKAFTLSFSHLFRLTASTINVLVQVLAFTLGTFIDARITLIRKYTTFSTMEQIMRHNPP